MLGKGLNLNSWIDHIRKYSPENQQKFYVQAQVIQSLAETWTPILGLGFLKARTTVMSHIKDLLSTQKTDREKEYIQSEASSEGDPTVAKLPEDTVNSKQLIQAPNINLNLPDSKEKKIHVTIGNCWASGLDDCLECLNLKLSKKI